MSRNNRKSRKIRADFDAGQGQVDTEKARPTVRFKPLNTRQRDYHFDLQNGTCIIAVGPAGTGKTFVAASQAAQDLAEKRIRHIVISRPNVPTGNSLGAFPGTPEEKMAPWLRPITNILKRQLGVTFYEYCVKTGAIQIQMVETIRGESFDDSVLLFDESQQLVIPEIKAIVTRIGHNSRLVLMGDLLQRDNDADGLEYLIGLAERNHLPVAVHKFTSDDIVRSATCKMFVKAFEAEAEALEKAHEK